MPEIPQRALRPYWQTKDGSITLYQGHATSVLNRMAEESAQMCVTSPPYWKLRSYATGEEHKPNELGSESTVEEFVANLVGVLRAVKRVLRPDGTLWLNLGDTYVKGNLQGVPWRVALALQADGWVLRSDIIWAKSSPMPESCTDRATKSHEYLFLFCKSGGYYYDSVAIREDAPYRIRKAGHKGANNTKEVACVGMSQHDVETVGRNKWTVWTDKGDIELLEWLSANYPDKLSEFLSQRGNKLDVWRIASHGYEGAHFATFAPSLVEPCILAGTSEHGCCSECGAPYERLTDRKKLTRERPNDFVKRTGEEGTGNSCSNSVAGVSVKTLGWVARCKCKEELALIGIEPTVVPCTVLDPFCGAATTQIVALAHGRHCIGIDLSETYLRENAVPRIQGALLNRPGLAHLAGFEATKFDGGASL